MQKSHSVDLFNKIKYPDDIHQLSLFNLYEVRNVNILQIIIYINVKSGKIYSSMIIRILLQWHIFKP